jgi:long-chain acyl-CoA synthetase
MTIRADLDARVEGQTVPSRFLDNLAVNGPLVALRWKNEDDSWSEMTYDEMAAATAKVAAGLRRIGVDKGDRVMLMFRNVHEFHIADLACVFLGATPVSIYNSSSAEQIAYLCSDARASIVLVENKAFFDVFSAARPQLPNVEKLGVWHADGVDGADFTSADLLSSEPIDLATEAGNTQPEDLATLIYTSGTTGPSKGVMLSHYNVCWTVESLLDMMEFPDSPAGKRIISYLPMAHIAERLTSYYQSLFVGYEVTCCPDPREIAAYAGATRPHVLFGVPRVWEKIYAGVNAALSADPEKVKAVGEAVEAAGPIVEKMTMGTASKEEIETYEFLDAVAFSTIRELVGLDQLITAITGAAPIPAEMLSWFRTIGVPLSEVYGLSETSGPLTWEPYRVKAGYVGRAIPGLELKLGVDGEVLCRGGNVFQGYLNLPDKTAEVLDAEGWFATGDIGVIDDEGYLKIVDRKKELIITAGGKNLSPSNLESSLKMIPLVGQAIAIGDQRPFVSALVVLDAEYAASWAAGKGIEYSSMDELADNAECQAEINEGLEKAMAGFNNAERVKKVKVLGDEWMPDTDLLTPTSKLKRRAIHDAFNAEIEGLYAK